MQILRANLKLLLSVFAACIALASLLYTSNLVRHLRERERTSVTIWAEAIKQVALAAEKNPYEEEFRAITEQLDPTDPMMQRYRMALAWASRLPIGDHIDFIFDIISKHSPDVPAAIVNDAGTPIRWQYLGVPEGGELTAEDSLQIMRRIAKMDRNFAPIIIALDQDSLAPELLQRVHYGESTIIRELRIYPYLQLAFVALFIGFAYLGFSYARRSEQSNLWVGMAREAAHQLGTPISSLMGWVEVMHMNPKADVKLLQEVDADIERLGRVANRFNDIGSIPKLERQELAPVIETTADYIRRRLPRRRVTLSVDVPAELQAPINAELFVWVIENLLKNAMDAIESEEGEIQIKAGAEKNRVYIDVCDSGKGIDRRDGANIFKPGYSTKKRGWGLGLSLAKRIIVDYHGGQLLLSRSVVGRGAIFRILLPQSQ